MGSYYVLRRSIPLLAGGILLLAACDAPLSIINRPEGDVSRGEWLTMPMHHAWVYTPKAGMLMVRKHGRVTEQQIALSNLTTLPRDNFIYLRTNPRASPGVMQLSSIVAQAGGLPEPFTTDDLNVMRTVEDAAGALTWAEWTDGAGTTCVLALRRLTTRERMLPTGTGAIDMLMRNCVRGSAQDALEPADYDHVVMSASAQSTGGTPHRSLSPLAAPSP